VGRMIVSWSTRGMDESRSGSVGAASSWASSTVLRLQDELRRNRGFFIVVTCEELRLMLEKKEALKPKGEEELKLFESLSLFKCYQN